MLDFKQIAPNIVTIEDIRTQAAFAKFTLSCERFGFQRALTQAQLQSVTVVQNECLVVLLESYEIRSENNECVVIAGDKQLHVPYDSNGRLLVLCVIETEDGVGHDIHGRVCNDVDADEFVVEFSDFLDNYPKLSVSVPLDIEDRKRLVGNGVIENWKESNYTEEFVYRVEDIEYPLPVPPRAIRCCYSKGETLIEYTLYLNKSVAYMELFYLPKSEQGNGLGLKLFIQQAKTLSNHYEVIENYANRTSQDIGYFVWYKFGFNGTTWYSEANNKCYEGNCKPDCVETSVNELVAKFGMNWWIENGASFEGLFSLTKDSDSMKTFQTYCKSKGVEL